MAAPGARRFPRGLKGACLALAIALCWRAAIDFFLCREYPRPPAGGAVLITGSSTGIGRHACLSIAKRDDLVPYCAVRRQEDAERLAAASGGRARTLILDVTVEADVRAAVAAMEASGLPLAALVNNAGLSAYTPAELTSMDDLRRLFEVNYFGVVRLTQALLPRLRAARGRVVNVGSIAGAIPPMVGFSAYAGTKAALEMFSDALRIEMVPFGVSVSLLQPGAVQSEILETAKSEGRYFTTRPAGAEDYGWYYECEKVRALVDKGVAMASSPSVTTAAIVHALTSTRPRARYAVANAMGIPAPIIVWAFWLLPSRLADEINLVAYGLTSLTGRTADVVD